MHKLVVVLFAFVCFTMYPQSKTDYLKNNRFDVTSETFTFPETNFTIIGFGAYHGSAKTYAAEINILKSLKAQSNLDYYFPEVNFSQAFFYQKYLETGDENLLKELVLAFQTIVNQEGTIETFEHWKKLRALNQAYPKNPIKILGCDVVSEYKFPIMHILQLTETIENWPLKEELAAQIQDSSTNLSTNNEVVKNLLKNFVTDYETNKTQYAPQIKDTVSFHHILKNIQYTFERKIPREQLIFDNYVTLKEVYSLADKKQFFKYGFFHIEKEREENFPSFFTRLIEEKVFPRAKIITVMGYFSKSEVLWNKVYDENGNYVSFKTEKGFGIGDYWKEYFKGIRYLKKNKLSNLTLYKLNNNNTPYAVGTDLIEVKLFLKASNRKVLKGKSTTDFIDYAVLIENSKNQTPIEELR